MRRIILAMLSAMLWFCSLNVEAATPTTDTLDQVEQALTGQKAVLVDVREHNETNAGYVAGAVLVPLSLLEEAQSHDGFGKVLNQMLPKGKVLYCYCVSGQRSLKAADLFAKFGYDARSLKHGFTDLVDEGFVPAKPKPK